MRRFRFTRLVLAAAVIGAVGLFTLSANGGYDESGPNADYISHVDWSNADQTNPLPPGAPTPSPSYDGDGTSDTDGENGPGDDGSVGGPTGEAGSPGSGPTGGGDEDDNDGGGLLGLAFPAQAGLSVGVLALAFLALLPGRRMPANLR